MDVRLHHFAYTIRPDCLELVLELLERLGCTISYKEKGWCMIEQKPIPIDIQLIETEDQLIPIEKKMNTHIAFLSDTPGEDIAEIMEWCKRKGINTRQGGWSERELWFDLPDVFVNFVIEIMHSSIVE
ncbi:MAG: hypothetical protein ACQESG_02285 [Nanobdellota archaeon]